MKLESAKPEYNGIIFQLLWLNLLVLLLFFSAWPLVGIWIGLTLLSKLQSKTAPRSNDNQTSRYLKHHQTNYLQSPSTLGTPIDWDQNSKVHHSTSTHTFTLLEDDATSISSTAFDDGPDYIFDPTYSYMIENIYYDE